MKRFWNNFAVIMLGAIVLTIPYYVGYYAAKNDGINFFIQIFFGVITLALADYKSYLNRKNS